MIRKASIEDMDFFYRLYMHPKVNPYLMYEYMPLSEFEPIYKELIQKPCLYVFFKDKQEPLGMFKLLHYEHRDAHKVYLGGLAIAPEHQGKGFGKTMLMEIISKVKNEGFVRLELTVHSENNSAITLYESVGFVKEGLLKKFTYLKAENTYIDEIQMAVLL